MAIAYLTSNDKLVLSGFAVLMVCISVVMRANKRRRLHYPPGPPPHFLWGNFFDLPKEKPYARYAEWSKTYGTLDHTGCSRNAKSTPQQDQTLFTWNP